MTKKGLVLAVMICAVVALLFPISNLFVGLPGDVTLGAAGPKQDAHKAVTAALAKKCANCHTAKGKIPFYANFPVAKSLIEDDIERGTRYLDLAAAFSRWPVGEVALAKIGHSIATGTMPPALYMLMHWNGALSASEQEAIMEFVAIERANHYASAASPPDLRRHVVQPLPPPPQVDSAKALLGNKLFHDGRLSKDNSISCASCHDLAKGGTDREQFSTGVGGKKGDINAPTVFNAAFNLAQFWDGRAVDLQAQADGPPNNPIEMASNWPEIVDKLNADERFKVAFSETYPEGFSGKTITDAIAEFEKTLVTGDSAFDRFLLGDQGALNAEARAGYDLFLSKACATCHVGYAIGGQSFEEMGRAGDYFGDRGESGAADHGRFNVTKHAADRHRFKVPLLRNVALTSPYFHDGTVADLGDAVSKMGTYMLGTILSQTEVKQIVAFLHSLTGRYQGKLVQ